MILREFVRLHYFNRFARDYDSVCALLCSCLLRFARICLDFLLLDL
ncbi:hypothetical protein HMPREF3230_00847 [Gardnerella vaginalis]|uniref:Uncharacterized protein n=1 Tax=Gardnerella vaginalis TaxID=2702 RepID=A0A135Z5E7_GARVA|nr:hypothetical protein HMPREF3230_00847 [Gardnerella vaginalis]